MSSNETPLSEVQVWSMYWAGGQRNSCLAAHRESDQQELSNYWRKLAQQLPKHARVLDLACGNGAVAYALQDSRADITIDAVDKSELNPVTAAGEQYSCPADQSKLSFHAKLDILDLPEKFNNYDLICSQFGIEYAGLLAIPEMLERRLKLGGRLAFLIHNKNGDLYESSCKKINEYKVLREAGLLRLMQSYLRSLLKENVEQQSADRQALELAGQQYMGLEVGTKPISGAIFDAISQLLSLSQQDVSGARKGFDALSMRISADQNRLEQMVAAAQSEDQIKKFDALFLPSTYIERKISDFHIGTDKEQYLLAWEYSARLK